MSKLLQLLLCWLTISCSNSLAGYEDFSTTTLHNPHNEALERRYKAVQSRRNDREYSDKIASAVFPSISEHNSSLLQALVDAGTLQFDKASCQYSFTAGIHTIDEMLVFPGDCAVYIQAGTTLVLEKSAALISFSPLYIAGSAEHPVTIESKHSGAGIAVINSAATSAISHTVFRNLHNIDFPDWQFGGAVTFFRSDVQIANSHFEDNHAEDMLWVVDTHFSITHSTFKQSSSDALDIDYAWGTIEYSVFSHCGNDCIDFSNSVALLKNIEANAAIDKAISVGEASDVEIDQSSISSSSTGVASKDLSETLISNSTLTNNYSALRAYQKKTYYGGATLTLLGSSLSGNTEDFFHDQFSSITIDGKPLMPIAEENRD